MNIVRLHHIAIICSDYEKSKRFYTDVLGFQIDQEVYREERKSYKLDLSLNGQYLIELFSFPDPPRRPIRPEATGLRHICLGVESVEATSTYLKSRGIIPESVRVDEYTGKKFIFFFDPDDLPIEMYEV